MMQRAELTGTVNVPTLSVTAGVALGALARLAFVVLRIAVISVAVSMPLAYISAWIQVHVGGGVQ